MKKKQMNNIRVCLDVEKHLITDIYFDGELFPYEVKSVTMTEDFQSVPEVTITIPCNRVTTIMCGCYHDYEKD